MDRSLFDAWNRLRGMDAIPDSILRRLLNGMSQDCELWPTILNHAFFLQGTRIVFLIEEGRNATLIVKKVLDDGSPSEDELVRIIESASVHRRQKERAAWILNKLDAKPSSLRVSIVNVQNQRQDALLSLLRVGQPDDWDFAIPYCGDPSMKETFVRKMIISGHLPRASGVVIPTALKELVGKLKSENQEREDLMKKLLGL